MYCVRYSKFVVTELMLRDRLNAQGHSACTSIDIFCHSAVSDIRWQYWCLSVLCNFEASIWTITVYFVNFLGCLCYLLKYYCFQCFVYWRPVGKWRWNTSNLHHVPGLYGRLLLISVTSFNALKCHHLCIWRHNCSWYGNISFFNCRPTFVSLRAADWLSVIISLICLLYWDRWIFSFYFIK